MELTHEDIPSDCLISQLDLHAARGSLSDVGSRNQSTAKFMGLSWALITNSWAKQRLAKAEPF